MEATSAPEVPAAPAAPPPDPEPVIAEVVDDIVAEPAPSAVVTDDHEIVAEPAPRRRAPPPTPPKPKRAGMIVGWAALAAAIAAIAGVVVFREQVVRMWPGGGGLFAAVGLPTDPLGLTIDQVRSVATLQGGRPVLSVTGAIRNARSETVTAPSLRISLLDRQGKPVTAKIARPLNAQIPPGATRYFAIAIPDPPAGSASLDIVFAEAATHTAEAGAVDAHMGSTPMGPAPVDATPAPEDHAEAPADHG